MSTRPDGLTDEMLTEMRRLDDTGPWVQAIRLPITSALNEAAPTWVCMNESEPHPGKTCRLTEAGHKALVAIEAEIAWFEAGNKAADEMDAGMEGALGGHDSESNSSAPLAGWTKDWPRMAGWWWVTLIEFPNERTAAYVELDDRGVWQAFTHEGFYRPGPNCPIMFHVMQQPPEPPKDTP